MKLFLSTIALALLLFLAFWLFPRWWWIIVLPFLFSLFVVSSFRISFLYSFIATLITWGLKTLFAYINGGDIIAKKMGGLLGIQKEAFVVLLVIFLGCIFSLFASLTGTALRTFFVKNRQSMNYY